MKDIVESQTKNQYEKGKRTAEAPHYHRGSRLVEHSRGCAPVSGRHDVSSVKLHSGGQGVESASGKEAGRSRVHRRKSSLQHCFGGLGSEPKAIL